MVAIRKEKPPTKKELRARAQAAARQTAWDNEQKRLREQERRAAEFAAAKAWADLCARYETVRDIPAWVTDRGVVALESLIDNLHSIDPATLADLRDRLQQVKRDCAEKELLKSIDSAFFARNTEELDILLGWRKYDRDPLVQDGEGNDLELPDPGIPEDRFTALHDRLKAVRKGAEVAYGSKVDPQDDDSRLDALRLLCRRKNAGAFEGHTLPENLLSALRMVKPFVPSRPSRAILGHVRIAHPGNGDCRFTLEAANGEIQIRVSVGCRAMPYVDTTVPVGILTDWVALADVNDPVALMQWHNGHEDNLTLLQSRHYATFKALPGSDFPVFPDMPAAQYTIRDIRAFKQACKLLSASVKKTDDRPILTAVNVAYAPLTASQDAQWRMTASDGYKLVQRAVTVESRLDEAAPFNAPAYTLATLAKILPDADYAALDPLLVSVDADSVYFAWDNVEIRSRLVEGKYPDFESVVPTKFNAKGSVYLEALEGAVKRFKGHKFVDMTVTPADSGHLLAPAQMRIYDEAYLDIRDEGKTGLEQILDCDFEWGNGFSTVLSVPLLKGILAELDRANPKVGKGAKLKSREVWIGWNAISRIVVFRLGEAQCTLASADRPKVDPSPRTAPPPPAGYVYGKDLTAAVDAEWKLQAFNEREAMQDYCRWLDERGLAWRCTDDLAEAIDDAVQAA